LGNPLGLDKESEKEDFNPKEFIQSLELSIYNDFTNYYFYDVLSALSKRMLL